MYFKKIVKGRKIKKILLVRCCGCGSYCTHDAQPGCALGCDYQSYKKIREEY